MISISSLEAVAVRINTGTDSLDTTRALVVFNMTDTPLNGAAVFHATMSWPRADPLPPILVTDMEGNAVPVALRGMTEAPDANGRADRHQLSFVLCFAVTDIPANGWRAYIAAYADAPSPPLHDFVETPGLSVVETLRHGGDLPPVGNL